MSTYGSIYWHKNKLVILYYKLELKVNYNTLKRKNVKERGLKWQ